MVAEWCLQSCTAMIPNMKCDASASVTAGPVNGASRKFIAPGEGIYATSTTTMSQWPFSTQCLLIYLILLVNCEIAIIGTFNKEKAFSGYCETLRSPVGSSSDCISSPYSRAAMQCITLVTADAGCCTLLTHCHILTSLQLQLHRRFCQHCILGTQLRWH